MQEVRKKSAQKVAKIALKHPILWLFSMFWSALVRTYPEMVCACKSISIKRKIMVQTIFLCIYLVLF